jgi:hypothetical protein
LIAGFAVTADQGEGELTSLAFGVPVTVTLSYSETVLTGSTEESLALLAHSAQASGWSTAGCGAVERDLAKNRLSVPICQLSTFGLFGSRAPSLYLPLTVR